MRLCLVSRELAPFFGAGIGVYAAAAAAAWRDAGHEVHVLTHPHPGMGRRPIAGVTVHTLDAGAGSAPAPGPRGEFLDQAWAVHRALRRLHRRRPLDYIEFPDYWAEGYYALRAARRSGGYAGAVLAVRLHTPTRLCRELNGEGPDPGAPRLEECEESALAAADVLLSPTRSLLERVRAALEARALKPPPGEVVPYPFDPDAAALALDEPPAPAGESDSRPSAPDPQPSRGLPGAALNHKCAKNTEATPRAALRQRRSGLLSVLSAPLWFRSMHPHETAAALDPDEPPAPAGESGLRRSEGPRLDGAPTRNASAAPQAAPARAAPSRVLYLGRLERRKGVELLVTAACSLLDSGLEAEFLFVGGDTATGPAGSSMLAHLRGLAAGRARVRFEPARPRRHLGPIIRSSAVCCFPSLWENFPNACVEAMSLGACVVGSDAGGMAEIIEDGGSGLLFRAGDAADLAGALRRALSDDALRGRLGRAAPARVRALCDPARVVSETEAAVRCAGARPRPGEFVDAVPCRPPPWPARLAARVRGGLRATPAYRPLKAIRDAMR